MTIMDFAIQFTTSAFVGIGGAGFVVWFTKSWISERLKNSIKAEYDLQLESHKAKLSELVEGVKIHHAKELERLRAILLSEEQVSERRRRIYEDICLALRIFVAGHGNLPAQQEKFHAAYATTWLWASDDILSALNNFLALNVKAGAIPTGVEQSLIKKAYVDVILAMRRDAGFPDTSIKETDYNFVKF